VTATVELAAGMEVDSSGRSDADLVLAARAGNRDAYATLVRRYERAARATAAQVLRDVHLARDAAQDGFISAYRSLASLRDPAAFGGWLLAIVRHRAMRLARQRRNTQPLHLASEASHPPASPGLDDGEHELLEALARLPEHERVVVMLRYFESYDLPRIAQVTGRPIGTVTKQLSRAHERLRKWLK
jgi:RNA polymerase sigma-70 factor (ECF subfamily)